MQTAPSITRTVTDVAAAGGEGRAGQWPQPAAARPTSHGRSDWLRGVFAERLSCACYRANSSAHACKAGECRAGQKELADQVAEKADAGKIK